MSGAIGINDLGSFKVIGRERFPAIFLADDETTSLA